MIAIYARVSTDGGSREQDPTLQVNEVQMRLAEVGKVAEQIYIDKESGDEVLRDDFIKLITAIKKKEIEELWVWKYDRLSRLDPLDSCWLVREIEGYGCKVVSTSERYVSQIEDLDLRNLILFHFFWAANKEKKAAQLRVKMAMDVRKRLGKSVGGRPKGSKDIKQRERRWQVKPDVDVHDLFNKKLMGED